MPFDAFLKRCVARSPLVGVRLSFCCFRARGVRSAFEVFHARVSPSSRVSVACCCSLREEDVQELSKGVVSFKSIALMAAEKEAGPSGTRLFFRLSRAAFIDAIVSLISRFATAFRHVCVRLCADSGAATPAAARSIRQRI
jgi:hypothetical protein